MWCERSRDGGNGSCGVKEGEGCDGGSSGCGVKQEGDGWVMVVMMLSVVAFADGRIVRKPNQKSTCSIALDRNGPFIFFVSKYLLTLV